MAGLDRITLGEGTVEDVTREALAAIAQTGSRRLILAPSCVIPPGAPEENLQAARDVVGA
jgi:uroporphyrinogen-III decarboxylase